MLHSSLRRHQSPLEPVHRRQTMPELSQIITPYDWHQKAESDARLNGALGRGILVSIAIIVLASAEPLHAEIRFDNVHKELAKSNITFQQLCTNLRKQGMRTPSDFAPLLLSATLSDAERCVAVGALENFMKNSDEDSNASILELTRRLSVQDESSGVRSSCIRLVLQHQTPDENLLYCATILDKVDVAGYRAIAYWVSAQDKSLFSKNEAALTLTKNIMNQLKWAVHHTLGQYDASFLALVTAMDQSPFNDPPFTGILIRAFLEALERPGEMGSYEIDPCFKAVYRNSEGFEDEVRASLLKIVTEGTLNRAKLLIWQCYTHRYVETEHGKKLIVLVRKRREDLVEYLEKFKNVSFDAKRNPYGTEHLKEEIVSAYMAELGLFLPRKR